MISEKTKKKSIKVSLFAMLSTLVIIAGGGTFLA